MLRALPGFLLSALLVCASVNAARADPRIQDEPAAAPSPAGDPPSLKPGELSTTEPRIQLAPIPAWVQPVGSSEDVPPSVAPEAPVRLRLFSEQIRVNEHSVETYRRIVKHFAHPAGLEQGAELAIDFNPALQKLTFHGVWREREGRRTSLFEPAQVKVIQQDRSDGSLTALLFVPEVVVGDTIEYAYSLERRTSSVIDRFVHAVEAVSVHPVDRWRLRLLWPAERTLEAKAHGAQLVAQTSETGGVQEHVWEQRDLAPVQLDDMLPSWFTPFAWLQLSEYAGWAEVAQWALPLYRLPETSSPRVSAKVAELAKLGKDGQRLVAALRFVQDQVRFVPLEPGPLAPPPRAPDETLERRFGDARDKALLLVTLLEALGVEAQVALVNTRAQHRIEAWLPSPAAFDHVIVRATLGGQVFWIDPSATLERGGLEQLVPPRFRRALVVDPRTEALTELPFVLPTGPEKEIDESFVATDRAVPVKLTVTTRHLGDSANRMRRRLAATSLPELSRELLTQHARRDSKIRLLNALEARDDPKANELTLVERYVIEDFWKDGRRDLASTELTRHVGKPRFTERTMPLAIAHPVHVRHVIRLDPPARLDVAPDVGTIEGDTMRLDYSFRGEGSTVVLEFRYQSLADAILPADIPQHLASIDQMQSHLGYFVRLDSGEARVAAPSKDRGRPAFFLPVFLFVLIVLFTVASGAFRARKQPPPPEPTTERRPPLRLEAAPGESAATALVVSDAQEQATLLRHLPCSCGTRGLREDTARVEIPLVLGGRPIIAVKWRCPTCAAERTAYFSHEPSRAA